MADDVVHGAFLTAYLKIEQFDDSRPFGPWFLRQCGKCVLETF